MRERRRRRLVVPVGCWTREAQDVVELREEIWRTREFVGPREARSRTCAEPEPREGADGGGGRLVDPTLDGIEVAHVRAQSDGSSSRCLDLVHNSACPFDGGAVVDADSVPKACPSEGDGGAGAAGTARHDRAGEKRAVLTMRPIIRKQGLPVRPRGTSRLPGRPWRASPPPANAQALGEPRPGGGGRAATWRPPQRATPCGVRPTPACARR